MVLKKDVYTSDLTFLLDFKAFIKSEAELVEQVVEQAGFLISKCSVVLMNFFVHYLGGVLNQFQPFWSDGYVHPSAVGIAGGSADQAFFLEFVHQPGSILHFVNHAFGENFDGSGLWIHPPEDAQNIELLYRNSERP